MEISAYPITGWLLHVLRICAYANVSVQSDSEQLSLVHDELLNGFIVTRALSLPPNLHFDETPVPQQHVTYQQYSLHVHTIKLPKRLTARDYEQPITNIHKVFNCSGKLHHINKTLELTFLDLHK